MEFHYKIITIYMGFPNEKLDNYFKILQFFKNDAKQVL